MHQPPDRLRPSSVFGIVSKPLLRSRRRSLGRDHARLLARNLGVARGSQGFTLVEALITVAIIAMLSAIAVPNYLNSLNKAKQSDAASQISQIQTGIQAYADEFLAAPAGWSDLARVTTVMTPAGVASGSTFVTITSQSGTYAITVSPGSPTFTISASSSQLGSDWDILACLNTSTGASQLQRGSGSAPPATPVCS